MLVGLRPGKIGFGRDRAAMITKRKESKTSGSASVMVITNCACARIDRRAGYELCEVRTWSAKKTRMDSEYYMVDAEASAL